MPQSDILYIPNERKNFSKYVITFYFIT
jgi:hypothetical protein